VVTIDADADVPMGVITDVKESLRGIESLKINYAKPEVKPVAMPIKESDTQQSTETRKIKTNNLLQVAVSADGTILLRGEKCSQSELKREVKRFIKNYHIYAMNTHRLHIGNLKNKEYSDFTTTALTMPNGERLCCPVSNGVISITSDKQTPFQTLSTALTTIDEAYNELRQDLARRVYNKPYDKLDAEYSQMIAQAIPKRVYMAEC
jgi:biopolymer transport protein ExbD